MSVTPETHQPAMAPYLAVAEAGFELYSPTAFCREALSAKVVQAGGEGEGGGGEGEGGKGEAEGGGGEGEGGCGLGEGGGGGVGEGGGEGEGGGGEGEGGEGRGPQSVQSVPYAQLLPVAPSPPSWQYLFLA